MLSKPINICASQTNMGRAPCCDKAKVKKGPWSPEEDAKLKVYIEQNGTGGNWITLPQKIGLERCGKSCRLRWLNYLRPNIRHGGFSEEEDNIICSLHVSIGSRWSIIAAQLPGRTDNDIKNYWNTRLKKKLQGKQRREHQAKALRDSSLKQETKREFENLNMTSEGVRDQVSFWNMVYNTAVAMPETNVWNQDLSYDPSSLRNMLVKLGGGFSEDDHKRPYNNIRVCTTENQQCDACDVNSSPQFRVCENTMNTASSVAVFHTSMVVNSDSPNEFHGANDNFPKDLSYLSFTNPDHNGSNTGTCSAETWSWGDSSSLAYSPNFVSDYEASRQETHKDFAFEEPR